MGKPKGRAKIPRYQNGRERTESNEKGARKNPTPFLTDKKVLPARRLKGNTFPDKEWCI